MSFLLGRTLGERVSGCRGKSRCAAAAPDFKKGRVFRKKARMGASGGKFYSRLLNFKNRGPFLAQKGERKLYGKGSTSIKKKETLK